MEREFDKTKKQKRVVGRKKRTLDPQTVIDYKYPDVLKRFITDRGKIIPRRISGANAEQQRLICNAVKQARYLGLIQSSSAHRTERGFSGEMAAATVLATARDRRFERQPYTPRDRDAKAENSTDSGYKEE